MKRMAKKAMALTLAMCLTCTAVPTMANQSLKVTKEKKAVKSSRNYVEGQAIVMYGNIKTSTRSAGSNIADDDMEVVETYVFNSDTSVNAKSANKVSDNGFSVSLVKSDKYSTKELISILKKKSNVKYAEPNYKIKASDYNDSYYKYLWGLDNKGQNNGTEGIDVNADTPLLDNKDNKERVIAIVDTGINYQHEDLKDIVWNNPYNNRKLYGEHGYDFVNYDTDPMDDNGHGSHCAGIAAGKSNNGVGIAGIAKSNNIKVMALKTLNEEGSGSGMDAIGAYNYIYKAQQLGVNVVAVNNSWGGSADEEDEIIKNLIELVGKKGAISVCAAGNDGSDNDENLMNNYPSSIDSPYIISVAASNEKDELAGFSNYGTESVDIAAPGADILSTVSYNCFNPGIYDNKDKLCSTYVNFDNESILNVFNEEGKMVATPENNEVAYGTLSESDGTMNVSTTNSEYFGEKSYNNKSLKWEIKGAQKDGMYFMCLPYTMKSSDTGTSASAMVKVSGPKATNDDWLGGDNSVIYAIDCKLDKNGKVDISDLDTLEDGVFASAYIDENGNYWSHFSGEVSSKSKKDEQHVILLCVSSYEEGDFTVYVDNWGISRENVSPDEFGMYDYYNGTSMATPYVTGAVAAVANAYTNENALQIKARILGSARNNQNFEGRILTGGALDLSKIGNPTMTIDKIQFNSKKQIEISGYYTDNAEVYINDKKISTISNNGKTILVDGKSYQNKSVKIKLVKGERSYEKEYFFATGTGFNVGPSVDAELNGGQMISNGGNLIYIDGEGTVSQGVEYKDEDTGKDDFYWRYGTFGFSLDVFGKEYENAATASIYNETDYVCSNGVVYGCITLDEGFAQNTILAYYDNEKGWKKLSNMPKEKEGLNGVILASYNGELYLMGGTDEDDNFSKTVMKYSTASKKWYSAKSLPEGRAYSKAIQVGKKIVVTLGSNGTMNVPANLIYDGTKWTKSKATIGKSIDTQIIEGKNKKFAVLMGEIGLVKGGIIYTNLRVDSLGDTFTYNIAKDKFIASKYALNASNLEFDNLYATTAGDKLYVVYGFAMADDEGKEFGSNKSKLSNKDFYDEDDYEDDAKILCIPIDSGAVYVEDTSEFGAYVEGTGYYLPGDTVTLKAAVMDKKVNISQFIVNGKSVKKGKTGYVYTARAYDLPAKITASVKAEYTDIYIKPGKTSVKKAVRAKNNKSIKLTLKKVGAASGYQIKYSTSKKFEKKVTKTVNTKKNMAVIKKLSAKKTYYIKARAYRKTGKSKKYGSWSKVKTVKVKKK